jgi:hypothetical protein
MQTTTTGGAPRGRPRRRPALPWLALLALLATEGLARADEPEELRAEAAASGRFTRQERPWGFLVDPSTPSAGVASLGYAFGLGSGISADRPIPVNLAATNGSHTVSLGYGVTDRVAPFASATFAENPASPGTMSSTVTAGAMVQLTRPGAPLRISLSAAGVHESASDSNGFSALAAASLDQGPLRLAANVRADKMFASQRDAVDVFTLLGASWRVFDVMRVGAEYVAQDLEDLFGEEAEGGARQAVGPSVALDLDGGRYQLALASGFGIGSKSPRALVRAALAVNF